MEHIIKSFAEALALPAARFLVAAWVGLYTLAAPQEERESRRAEIRSDLHEHIDADQGEGIGSTAIAIRIFLRMLCGLPGDVAWAVPYFPATLARGLMRGSEIITRPETLKGLVPVLAVLCVFSWLSSFSDDSSTIRLAYSVGVPAVMLVMSQQHRSWVRRTANLLLDLLVGLTGVAAVSLFVWITVQYRLYQVPVFWPSMLSSLSAPLAIAVCYETVRVRVFGGRWRRVAMCWTLIAASSLIATAFFPGSLAILLRAWVPVATVALTFAMLVATVLVVALVWYGGLRLTAVGMRCMAKGIQRVS